MLYDESFGDGFIFTAPLQSWRSMGTCYIVVPTVDANTEPAGYSVTPVKATVQLSPWHGSSVDLTDTTPQPTADQVTQGAFDWTCYDFSGAGFRAAPSARLYQSSRQTGPIHTRRSQCFWLEP